MIRRTRPSGTLVVAGLIALALVIFGAVVVATRTHHRRAAVDGARLRVPPLPSGGLPGFAKVVGVGFSSAREGAVWFSDAAGRYWQASTRDGGAHWTTVRGASYVLVSPGRFSGRDGVAVGQTPEGDIHTYVTHDGGVSWVT